jgi:hypothetical protein
MTADNAMPTFDWTYRISIVAPGYYSISSMNNVLIASVVTIPRNVSSRLLSFDDTVTPDLALHKRETPV